MWIDFTRPPTSKEKVRLQTRLRRITADGYDDHLATLNAKIQVFRRPAGTLDASGLRIRPSFSYLDTPIPGDSSDRKAPPRDLRPPATKISSSLGSALRLQLLAMALVQLHRKPGAKAHLVDLGMSIAGNSKETGWADLVAAQPADSNNGGVLITSRDKRARTVRSALCTLDQAGLIDLPGQRRERNRFEGFVLLNEAGVGALGERQEYIAPTAREMHFQLPPGFVLNDWLHLLEDSEIAVILMAACTRGAWMDVDGMWVFPAGARLLHYGIHRDPYAAARKTLEWLGILEVREVGRHEDGRAEDNEQLIHRIQLRTEGFEQPALPAVRELLGRQITR